LKTVKLERANSLGGDTLDLALPFSVFNRLDVTKINVKHANGWVTLQVSETMSQEDGRILPARITQRDLSISRQSEGVWVISDPRERTYLAKEQALEIFERQAELYLKHSPNSSSARMAVKALDRLYDQEQGTPQRVAIR
jgi:hypothetical protein